MGALVLALGDRGLHHIQTFLTLTFRSYDLLPVSLLGATQ